MQKILVWTKQHSLDQLIAHQFSDRQIFSTTRLEKAQKLCKKTNFDLAILDYGREKPESLDFIEHLREASFSTKTMVIGDYLINSLERTNLYQAGASDILVHPFSPLELNQRITNLLGFVKIYPNQTICAGPVRLNSQTGTLTLKNGRSTPLRKKENEILACLIRHRPSIVTKTMLLNYVWGNSENTPSESTLDVYIRRLRIHLGEFHHLIKTSRGFGYYFA